MKFIDPVNEKLVVFLETALDMAESVVDDLNMNDGKVSQETLDIIQDFETQFIALNNEVDRTDLQ